MHSMLRISYLVWGSHTMHAVDTYGDGWHGGYWSIYDQCGDLVAGGRTNGQVNGTVARKASTSRMLPCVVICGDRAAPVLLQHRPAPISTAVR